jgi:hypothetical protein
MIFKKKNVELSTYDMKNQYYLNLYNLTQSQLENNDMSFDYDDYVELVSKRQRTNQTNQTKNNKNTQSTNHPATPTAPAAPTASFAAPTPITAAEFGMNAHADSFAAFFATPTASPAYGAFNAFGASAPAAAPAFGGPYGAFDSPYGAFSAFGAFDGSVPTSGFGANATPVFGANTSTTFDPTTYFNTSEETKSPSDNKNSKSKSVHTKKKRSV